MFFYIPQIYIINKNKNKLLKPSYSLSPDYRITKYCGEILPIGHEKRPLPEESSASPSDSPEPPVAAASMQLLNDQSFHQFTNLKIIKPDAEKPKKQKTTPNKGDVNSNEEAAKKKQKESSIYSQDFRVLKILPADTIDFNEIELIGEDFYFGNKLQEQEEEKEATTSGGAEGMVTDDSSVLVEENFVTELVDNAIVGGHQRTTTTTVEEDILLDNLVIGNTISVTREEDGEQVGVMPTSGGKLLLGSEDYGVDDIEEEERRLDDEDDEFESYYYDYEEDIALRNKGKRRYKR